MRERTPRLEEIFFEVFEPLPRQGPSNRARFEVCPFRWVVVASDCWVRSHLQQ